MSAADSETTRRTAAQAAQDLLVRISGRFPPEKASGRFAVTNPLNGEVIAEVADGTPEDALAAVERAATAMPAWARATAHSRSDFLHRWRSLIIENIEALAFLLTLEQGKPVAEARTEILFGADYLKWFAEEAVRAYGDIVPSNAGNRRMLVLKQPVGVVAALTPWNFPSGMITRKVAPALAAGCAVVLKPAEDTPLSALALQILAEDAGLPGDLFTVVTCKSPADVAAALVSAEKVRKISFTGSTRVGKLLMRQASDGLKRLSLELGGNAPFIVFEDADLDAVIAGAVMSKFRNAGQTCISANRFLVHADVADAFTSRLAERAQAMRLGDGRDDGVEIGPMIRRGAVDRVAELVAATREQGADVIVGGETALDGAGYVPTLLGNVGAGAPIISTEIFGPVAPVITFTSDEEAIRIANDTPYGLAAYFWTRSYDRAWRIGEALEYGMVGLNEGIVSNHSAPFGGMKESGMGREGSRYGLSDFQELKYLAMGGLAD